MTEAEKMALIAKLMNRWNKRQARFNPKPQAPQNPRPMLKATVSQNDYADNPTVKLPAAVYNDPYLGKVDLWKKLNSGDSLSDAQMKQLFLAIDTAKFAAQNAKEFLDAEGADYYAKEQLAQNLVDNAKHTPDGLIMIRGLALTAEEAAVAASMDIDYFRDNDKHLTPQQLTHKLKDLAVGLWDFAIGDDLHTLTDNTAHPLARTIAAISLITTVVPETKLAKMGKLLKVSRYSDEIWTTGRFNNSILNRYYHAMKHRYKFNLKTPEEYFEQAHNFIKNPPLGTELKNLQNGQKAMYHAETNTFIVVDKHGIPATMYKPDEGRLKFDRQK